MFKTDFANFWQIIEAAKVKANSDVRFQEKLLEQHLVELELEEFIIFYHTYLYYNYKAYFTEMWAAAILISCGCSDDSFYDFRDWLILQGKNVYEQALQNPDTLVETAPFGFVEARADLSSTIANAWEKKMGIEKIPDPTAESWQDMYTEEEKKPIDGSKLEEEAAMEFLPKLGAKSREIFSEYYRQRWEYLEYLEENGKLGIGNFGSQEQTQ